MNQNKKAVLHCNETYAKIGENYIFDQVCNVNCFDNLLFSEKCLVSDYNPVLEKNRKSLRPIFSNLFVERLFNWLTLKVFELPYIYILTLVVKFKFRKKLEDIALVHFHFGHTACKFTKLAKQLKVPTVVTFYGVDASACVVDPYWSRRMAAMLQQVTVVIVLCEDAKKSIISLDCDPNKIIVWDIGIPLDNYKYRSPRIIRKYDIVKFLIVARFVRKKGYIVLLDAMDWLVKNNINVSLTIIGYGPLKSQIESKIEVLKLKKVVNLIDSSIETDFFTVFKKNLLNHDIFVLPSVEASDGDNEGGTPVVITNAMAVGLPVISTPIGGIDRVIINNKTGFLVKPNSASSLHARMKFICQNTSIWKEISMNARDLIQKDFSKKNQLEKITSIYRGLVD
jgi:colanic acid/amylovoran biosynthesis glycosyltransferase